MNVEIDFSSSRAKRAKFAKKIGKNGYRIFYLVALLFGVASIYLFIFAHKRLGYISLALSLAFFMYVIWYFQDLSKLAPKKNPKNLHDILSAHLLAHLAEPISPKSAFEAAMNLWQAKFISNHLLLSTPVIIKELSDKPTDMANIWKKALALTEQHNALDLDAGTLMVAIILNTPSLTDYLSHLNLRNEDVLEVHAWLERLHSYMHLPKPNFGGIGRDWATGFTPNLERFSTNISRQIEVNGGFSHFLSHVDVLNSIVSNLDKNTSVALVALPGSGKTSLVYGLAQRLLEGKDERLKYYQIISLNAASIISAGAGQIEGLMLNLFGEAIHAGNIILFLDEAQLFFSGGVGAFNMSQLLLPILQNRRIKVIAAFPPNSWQQLKTNNESLAFSFAPIIIQEPNPADTMKIVEDSALLLENRDRILITYQALREVYRLSGQYMQEEAYPGKAINALEQSLPYADERVLTDVSVQTSLEKTRGVKVGAAQAPEADKLLHLEDQIHARMINQERAVNVVSAALRRGRAGVSNPKRPVGSFLFLGPTGVGKTELARSLAAVYFNSEEQMIRLDMTEYQEPQDVSRLLSAGTQGERSLLMSIRQQPFSVVLLDEIEKANPQILNLLLQLLDEGQLTDSGGRPASFRSAIIIATSNAGSSDISARVKENGSLQDFERPLIDKLIAGGQFKPELINRFDEIVLFRPLNAGELGQVAKLMLNEVNKTLANQNISVELTDQGLQVLVQAGYDPEFGARPMRRVIQKTVEDLVANKILSGEAKPGSVITLTEDDLKAQLENNQ